MAVFSWRSVTMMTRPLARDASHRQYGHRLQATASAGIQYINMNASYEWSDYSRLVIRGLLVTKKERVLHTHGYLCDSGETTDALSNEPTMCVRFSVYMCVCVYALAVYALAHASIPSATLVKYESTEPS